MWWFYRNNPNTTICRSDVIELLYSLSIRRLFNANGRWLPKSLQIINFDLNSWIGRKFQFTFCMKVKLNSIFHPLRWNWMCHFGPICFGCCSNWHKSFVLANRALHNAIQTISNILATVLDHCLEAFNVSGELLRFDSRHTIQRNWRIHQ